MTVNTIANAYFYRSSFTGNQLLQHNHATGIQRDRK